MEQINHISVRNLISLMEWKIIWNFTSIQFKCTKNFRLKSNLNNYIMLDLINHFMEWICVESKRFVSNFICCFDLILFLFFSVLCCQITIQLLQSIKVNTSPTKSAKTIQDSMPKDLKILKIKNFEMKKSWE